MIHRTLRADVEVFKRRQITEQRERDRLYGRLEGFLTRSGPRMEGGALDTVRLSDSPSGYILNLLPKEP
jgi:hypothetical protein